MTAKSVLLRPRGLCLRARAPHLSPSCYATANNSKTPKNSTFTALFIIFVLYMKIQGEGACLSCPPAADVHDVKAFSGEIFCIVFRKISAYFTRVSTKLSPSLSRRFSKMHDELKGN